MKTYDVEYNKIKSDRPKGKIKREREREFEEKYKRFDP